MVLREVVEHSRRDLRGAWGYRLAEKLRLWLSSSTPYLPFTLDLKVLKPLYPVLGGLTEVEEVYGLVGGLLAEVSSLTEPIRAPGSRRCTEVAGPRERSVSFDSMYLSFHKGVLLHVLDLLAFRGAGCGSRDLMVFSAWYSGLRRELLECRSLEGFKMVARVYDAVLVFLGAALYWPGPMTRRECSCNLLTTPFTTALQFVLTYPSDKQINTYVEALKRFVGTVVSGYSNEWDEVLIATSAGRALSGYTAIRINTDEGVVRRTVAGLLDLLHHISK